MNDQRWEGFSGRGFMAACAALCLSFCFAAHVLAQEKPRVLVLGDSLSAAYGFEERLGWVALFTQKLDAEGHDMEVVNASISGETTQGALARLPQLLRSQRPAVVIVELGANDGLRGFPLSLTSANLQHIIDLCLANEARVALLGMRIPPNYGRKYADEFYALFPQLAQVNEITFVPFFLDGVAGDMTLVQADGLHPTAQAQPALLANIWPPLAELLAEIR